MPFKLQVHKNCLKYCPQDVHVEFFYEFKSEHTQAFRAWLVS